MYITIKVREIYHGKFEIFSFIIESGRKLTISVEFDVNVQIWGREGGVSFISSFLRKY